MVRPPSLPAVVLIGLWGLLLYTHGVKAAEEKPTGTAFMGQMAGAVLDALFPPLATTTTTTKAPIPPPTSIIRPRLAPNPFSFGSAPAGRSSFAPPGVQSSRPNDAFAQFSGVKALQNPALYRQSPNFLAAQRIAAQQQFLSGSSSIGGRTDLPGDYVYPFAQPGVVISPDAQSRQTFFLPENDARVPVSYEPVFGVDGVKYEPVFKQEQVAAFRQTQTRPRPPTQVRAIPPPLPSSFESTFVQSASGEQTTKRPSRWAAVVPKSMSAVDFAIATEMEMRTSEIRKAEATNGVPLAQLSKHEVCVQCQPIDLRALTGTWTQIYAHPQSIKMFFTTLNSLRRFDDIDLSGDGPITFDMTPLRPTCVGLSFGQPMNNETTANLFYRDNSAERKLNEFKGVLTVDQSRKDMNLKVPGMELPLCMLRSEEGYMVLTETLGERRCRAMHVFARHTQSFYAQHHKEVAKYLATSVEFGRLPVSAVPLPNLCELPQTQIVNKPTAAPRRTRTRGSTRSRHFGTATRLRYNV